MGFFSRIFGSRAGEVTGALPEGKRFFLESVLAAVRDRFPSCRFEPQSAIFAIVIHRETGESVLQLDAAWEQERRAQLALSRGVPAPLGGVAYVVRVLAAGLGRRATERAVLLDRVIPMVVPAVRPGLERGSIVRRPLRANTLDSAFAIPGERVRWIDRELLHSVRVTPFELAAAASANLRRLELPQEDLSLLRGPEGDVVAIVVARVAEPASCWAFHPRLAERFGSHFPAGFHVAVPDRDLLVAAPADGRALLSVARLVRERFDAAPNPISPLLFPASVFSWLGV